MIEQQNPPVTFWSWDMNYPEGGPHGAIVTTPDGPYRGDTLLFYRAIGDVYSIVKWAEDVPIEADTASCQIVRPAGENVPVMSFHRCDRHKLILVRWQSDDFNTAHPLPHEEATA